MSKKTDHNTEAHFNLGWERLTRCIVRLGRAPIKQPKETARRRISPLEDLLEKYSANEKGRKIIK